jgi:hypothetical protein
MLLYNQRDPVDNVIRRWSSSTRNSINTIQNATIILHSKTFLSLISRNMRIAGLSLIATVLASAVLAKPTTPSYAAVHGHKLQPAPPKASATPLSKAAVKKLDSNTPFSTSGPKFVTYIDNTVSGPGSAFRILRDIALTYFLHRAVPLLLHRSLSQEVLQLTTTMSLFSVSGWIQDSTIVVIVGHSWTLPLAKPTLMPSMLLVRKFSSVPLVLLNGQLAPA